MTKFPSVVVVVVDDKGELAHLFMELLKGTVSFTNSILALKHLMEDPQKHSLIITGLGMRGLNEIEIAKKIRELSLKVKIVLTTALYSKENLQSHDFEKANISNVIEKTVKLAELRTRVNELCITC